MASFALCPFHVHAARQWGRLRVCSRMGPKGSLGGSHGPRWGHCLGTCGRAGGPTTSLGAADLLNSARPGHGSCARAKKCRRCAPDIPRDSRRAIRRGASGARQILFWLSRSRARAGRRHRSAQQRSPGARVVRPGEESPDPGCADASAAVPVSLRAQRRRARWVMWRGGRFAALFGLLVPPELPGGRFGIALARPRNFPDFFRPGKSTRSPSEDR